LRSAKTRVARSGVGLKMADVAGTGALYGIYRTCQTVFDRYSWDEFDGVATRDASNSCGGSGAAYCEDGGIEEGELEPGVDAGSARPRRGAAVLPCSATDNRLSSDASIGRRMVQPEGGLLPIRGVEAGVLRRPSGQRQGRSEVLYRE